MPPIVHDVLRDAGRPLDPATRQFMESAFGRDFSRVRVHTGAVADASSVVVGARAYAAGEHLAFAAGQFQPDTVAGRSLLAHELAHVVQQRGQSGTPTRIGSADDPVEHEADLVSAAVARRRGMRPISRDATASLRRDIQIGDPFPGGSAGQPPEGMKGCHVILGGRGIEHPAGLCVGTGEWCLGARHLYIDYFKGPGDTGVIEAGPDGTPPKSGAWVKPSAWEPRGVQWELRPSDPCRFVDCLKTETVAYHAAGHPYDPTSGPNSNSFAVWVLGQCGMRVSLPSPVYWQSDYWRQHPSAAGTGKGAAPKGGGPQP